MKQYLFSLFSILSLVGVNSFATSTVCSSEQLYFSDVRKDYGTQPQPGMLLGTRVIVYKGQVLVKHEFIQGLGQHTIFPFQATLVGEAVVLEKQGNQISGNSVFKQQAVLSKMTLNKAEVVAQVEVVCKSTWAMVP